VSFNQHRIPIELTTSAGKRRVVVDGREFRCDWMALPDGRYSIITDGRVFDLSVDVGRESCTVVSRNASHLLRLIDGRRHGLEREAEEGQAGLRRLNAEMPGKVVRILVQAGQKVEYDQGLLVLEAMKMQNEIRAPKGGIVKEIGVAEGRAVSTGEFLISLE
jgi:biotin carboxyl carrier protein